jgi:DNA-binding transcriptional regulator LsrR (DeoR family)
MFRKDTKWGSRQIKDQVIGMWQDEMTMLEIAFEIGCSNATVFRIIKKAREEGEDIR